MNRVIVGFDFSSGSAYAVDLAIQIANRWQSDIRLVYVKEKSEDEAPIRAEIERRIDAVRPLLNGIGFDYVVRQGKAAEQLASQAEADNAQLLIVGTHGMSGMKTNILGHNSYRTIELSPVPVLIVREDFNISKKLNAIVVPIDSSDDTRQKAAHAGLFARSFGATVHLLGLYTSTSENLRQMVRNYVAMVKRTFDKQGVPYVSKFMDVDKNLTSTILDYAAEVDADLIAIMTEQESSLSNLVLGTYAQQMITRSKVPVLTVRPQKVTTDTVNY